MAAFNMAMAVKASKPIQVGRANILVNPTAGWQREQYDRKDKAPSMPVELLQQVWNELPSLDAERPHTAKLWLLLAGQRMDQLRRVTWSDVTLGSRPMLTIRDAKGRGGVYIHELPLTNEMIEEMHSISTQGYVFSRDRGRTPVHARYFDDLLNALRHHIEIPKQFTPNTIRASVTTVLTSHKVSYEVRNVLQSHNRGDIETRHYQGHDFYDSKLEAMQVWRSVLNGDS
jgi:integrase